ncbi:MAG: type II toxin-antitoxin system prevent-host-death family antitoxin [Gammaproteobacteria bacterium]|nr:type II toxin-antitoxin system prevent-host-death family antitoxin [Gammaproteobacteria bacterium]
MKTINMHDAKSTLSKIVEHVERENEEVFIARRGVPCARIVPVKKLVHRPKGLLKGKVKIKQDLDAN